MEKTHGKERSSVEHSQSMTGPFKFYTRTYTRKGLYQLFMVCAFPIHIWAIIMAFRDFSWVAERTNTWDAVGLFSYAVVFAFLESLGVFLVVVLIGTIVSRRWQEEKRLAVLGTLFLMLALWAILGQVYSMNGYPVPQWIVDFLIMSHHPFRYLWGGVFLVVTASVASAGYLVFRSEKARKAVLETFERIAMLSSLYMAFDVLAVIVIILRNVRV